MYCNFQYVKERFGLELGTWGMELAPRPKLNAKVKIQLLGAKTKKLLQKTYFAHDAFLLPCNTMTYKSISKKLCFFTSACSARSEDPTISLFTL